MTVLLFLLTFAAGVTVGVIVSTEADVIKERRRREIRQMIERSRADHPTGER